MVYTDEHILWVKDNHNKYNSYAHLTEGFNIKFNTTKSTNAIQQFLTKKLNIYLKTDKKSYHYTKEEENWLISNFDKFEGFESLTNALNKEFGNDRVWESVREKCNKSLGLKIGNPTSFKKGHKQEQCPIGTIRKSSNGFSYIKVKDSAYSYINGYAEPYWLPLQKKVWLDVYGEVPDDKMVIFLDGNRDNLDINNLYCIDRKIAAIMAKNRWYTSNKDNTLAAIKWCELYYALKM